MEILNLQYRPMKNKCGVFLLSAEGKMFWTYKYRVDENKPILPNLLAECLRHPLVNCAYYIAVLYNNGKVKMWHCEDVQELFLRESIVASSPLVVDYCIF